MPIDKIAETVLQAKKAMAVLRARQWWKNEM
jgi:hypothetical protein